jgi:hypothetical protein
MENVSHYHSMDDMLILDDTSTRVLVVDITDKFQLISLAFMNAPVQIISAAIPTCREMDHSWPFHLPI